MCHLKARLTELNENEILKYLNYRGQEYGTDVRAQISRCIGEVMNASAPRLVWKRLVVRDGKCDSRALQGNTMKKILEASEEIVLMGVTLGAAVERLLMRQEVVNMADAVIMDSCASTAVENVCNNFEADLRQAVEKEGLFLSDRFSPGYGDFPLDAQRDLCAELDTARRIGVSLSPSLMLVPRKSVTAVLGISKNPFQLRGKGCEVCSMFCTCSYRKSGTLCREDGRE